MGYVKNKIKIRNTKTHRSVKPYMGPDGRLKVNMYDKDNVMHVEDLAEIVARTFPELVKGTYVEGGLPMFIDGNPTNCAADNLFWPVDNQT